MDTFLILAVSVLAILAIMDLMVGVGNDAVNFLNSAVGSKVASYKTIMWIATAGVFIGALSSAGMMEIAREGIFNPQYFSLYDLIVIFLAVMLTDIILLDAFNTIGLPTSTTVSIIFELLGASVAVAIIKVLSNNLPMSWLFNINDPASGITGYLNWSKTNSIIFGIFLSILLAFAVGVLIMFISRLIFSFNYNRKFNNAIIIWAALAMLSMSYFLVYKGLKSTYSTERLTVSELLEYKKSVQPGNRDTITASNVIYIKDLSGKEIMFTKVKSNNGGNSVEYEVFFGSRDIKRVADYIKKNMAWFLLIVFSFWVLIFYFFQKVRLDPLKFVVLAGTFSLAMAFAGNDLVNFIGVPLAGWQSVELYSAAKATVSGLTPYNYTMTGLKFPLQTPYIFLFIAGLVMVLTLWFSKKARSVTETSVNLSTQEETDERFSSNFMSRMIVRSGVAFAQAIGSVLPEKFQHRINQQFTPVIAEQEAEVPAFDLIRASVNLTIASMLIALGTSLKLPLSTTYVTFMVAMGASLADRAWGRETAAYRIAGVINVIGGWFLTAITAFIAASLVATLLFHLKLTGLILMLAIIGGFMIFTGYKHRRAQLMKNNALQSLQSIDLTTDKAMQKTARKIADSLEKISESYIHGIDGLLSEDLNKINIAKLNNDELKTFYSDIKNNLFRAIKKSKLSQKKTAQLYILSNDMMQDMLQSMTYITNAIDNHVKNAHKPLTEMQMDTVRNIQYEVIAYLGKITASLHQHEYDELGEIRESKRLIFDHIEDALSAQVDGISRKEYGFKNTDILLNILLETKDLVAIAVRFSKLLHRLHRGESPLGNRDR